MQIFTRLEPDNLDPELELKLIRERASSAGAVASFVGIARGTTADGSRVDQLFLDHYPGFTERSLKMIADAAAARFEVLEVTVIHRCGIVPAGEPIVLAAAAALHRRAAFRAADYLMDKLKTEAAFWKREEGPDGQRWIEPTEQDYADQNRWSEPVARS